MPTYQYACTECDHGFEAVQSFTDDALTDCPQCQGRLRKVFNSVGIVFKGSGFYRTDSREKPKSSSATSENKSESKAESKSETKTETTAKKESTGSAASSGAAPSSTSSSTAGSAA